MTKQTKTREVVETKQVERKVTDYETRRREEKVEVTTCNWCGQSYEEDEDVDFVDVVRNPQIRGGPSRSFRFEELLSWLEAYEAVTSTPVYEVGSSEPMMEMPEYHRVGSTHRAIIESIRDFVERSGGPRDDRLEHLGPALGGGTHAEKFEPRFLFELDLDLEIGGDELHICEYCDDNLEMST